MYQVFLAWVLEAHQMVAGFLGGVDGETNSWTLCVWLGFRGTPNGGPLCSAFALATGPPSQPTPGPVLQLVVFSWRQEKPPPEHPSGFGFRG